MSINSKIIIDFLNVGFGECIVVRNDQHTIVIDGGDSLSHVYEKNPYRTKLLTYLQREGISVIDLLILTHPHRDHIGGLVEVATHLKIIEAWYPIDILTNNMDQLNLIKDNNMFQALEMYKDILSRLEQKGTLLKTLSKIHNCLISDIDITVFPTIALNISDVQKNIDLVYNGSVDKDKLDILHKIDKKLNSCSLVLSIDYHDTRILLTSDILLTYWEWVQEKDRMKASILKLPHHGDVRYVSKKFLEQVNPNYGVVCADNENTYDLPSDNIEAYVKGILPDIDLSFTETKESQYNTIRFIVYSDGSVEKEDYRLII